MTRDPVEKQEQRRRKIFVCAGLFMLGVVGLLFWMAVFQRSDGRLHLWMLDVGQGDALLIETPRGRTVLVDGGPDPLILQRALGVRLPFWRRSLDLLVLTHPHADHLAGLVGLLDGYAVGQVLATPYTRTNALEDEWRRRLSARGLSPVEARRGQVLDLEPGVAMRVEYPPARLLSGTGSDANNASVVLRLSYGTVDMLLAGDVEHAGVDVLLRDAAAEGSDLRSEVIKVPHQGAADGLNDALLRAVQPDLALISVAAGNTYGHPAPETLGLLANAGVPVMRTDVNGTVEIISDGQRIWTASER